MKIYVITKGLYDDYEILAVTTDKDQADKYKEAADDGTDDFRVEEHEDLSQLCGWGKLPWIVSYDTDVGDYVATISDGSCESQKFDIVRMIPGYTDLFDLKTMMLFADAISRVKTSREKQLEAELEQVKKERDKAISDFHKAVKENGICSSCKHRFKECSTICLCDYDGEDHWEWEGLNG